MLTPDMLIAAYSQGIFPMADEDGTLGWYEPTVRAIIPLDAFHVPKRLARTVRNGGLTVHVDTAFEAVVRACA
ncbi:MAG: leucyl/phenylalanyl-tRNA--protein transferase, partial [Oscillochloris sp.]|nr:leucyl/phenylalanyl-tRNA--protein transferase [Oscillochloris sp.]